MSRERARVVWIAAALLLATLPACAPKTTPPPAPGAPRFPEFVFPAPPAALAGAGATSRHQAGWQWLQAGDLRSAEREFSATLKGSPQFFPAEAGLAYVALARKNFKEAAVRFDRALAADPAYAPALAGRGEALLGLGDRPAALASFEAALTADPGLGALRSRIDVLRFRGLQDDITAARSAAESGRLAEARQLYERAIAASPESPFLHRELAAVEHRERNYAAALSHAQRAAQLDPSDSRAHVLAGEIYEALAEFGRAADAYAAAAALEPSEALTAKVEALRERAALAALPPEYRAIETSPSITRAQLAALIGVQLEDLLKRSRRRPTVVMTDTRDHWAAPWILGVVAAGVMEAYPNHAFQPNAVLRRGELAAAASRALALVGTGRPKLEAAWRNSRRRFPDVPPSHLSYPAVAMVVEAGVMTTMEDGSFQLTRPVSGAEAMAAVRKLRELSGSKSR